ncbi:MAG: glycosyltransferase [Nocardioidaceae bacterium]
MSQLVVVSLEAWDGVWRRNQHLMSGLLARDPQLKVLFVEPPADPTHAAMNRQVPRRGHGLRPGPLERLWLHQPTKLLPRRVDRQSDARWAGGVVRATRRIGFDRPLIWANSTQAAHLLALTGWPAVYDITDDWLAAERPAAEAARLRDEEALLLTGCREVIVCSERLRRDKPHRSLTLVPNAVDLAAYGVHHPRPVDLPEGPTAVYVGTVHRDRTDVPLVAATARDLDAAGRLVLVGPMLLDQADRRLLGDAGVILLGPKEHDDVPAYLQHATVLVVPHVVNAFTDSLDPIKVYEYEAAGRPVVSTPVAGFRDRDDPLVRVSEPSNFAAAVRDALDEAEPQIAGSVRPHVATWSTRVDAVREVLERLAEPR